MCHTVRKVQCSPLCCLGMTREPKWLEVPHTVRRGAYTQLNSSSTDSGKKKRCFCLFCIAGHTYTRTHTTPCFKLYLNNSRLLEKASLPSPLQSLNLIQFFHCERKFNLNFREVHLYPLPILLNPILAVVASPKSIYSCKAAL